MDRNAALARLGLTGEEDAAGLTRAYGQRLAIVQGQLVSAQSDAERERHQNALSGLVEAYEFLTGAGPFPRARTDDSSATALRDPATPPPASAHDASVRMETGAVLSGRLELGAMLGQGGMGHVYAAHDRLRDEDVAIKVLRQDLIFSTAAKERFLAEAKLSSNLSHPNIVRVYDVGESGGHYYLSMERLFGHTLRQRIEAYRRDKRAFSLAEATDIARQLIEALRYAHRYIVHRDLKPENIWLVDDGTVKLMDFGIARAFSSSNMTLTGMMLGTAYYMAPEQRLDAKEVDWRADQYALGVVLYELLAGTIPMGAIKSLDQIRRDVPPRYARAVMRAMSPKPEERFPSLAELLGELEAPAARGNKAALWLMLGVGIAAAAGGAVWYFTRAADGPEFVRQVRLDELPMVAVLPLENLTGRKELDWAGAGIANLVRDGLAQSKYLAIVSAERTRRLTNGATNVDEVFARAADSGISHVLTGEVLRTPQGLTVTSRLTDLRRNVEVGANRQESLDPEELVGVSTPLASLIKQGLGVPGTEKVDVFAADYATKNVAAYEAFVVGMQHFLAFDYGDAKQMFEAAVQKAPDFAMARYRLAHADAALGDTDAAVKQLRLAKQEAARLSAREQQYIAAGEGYFSYDYPEAEKRYRALVEAYPYESEARTLLVYTLWAESKHEDALVQAEALVAQDPGDEVGWSSIADLNLRLGHYGEAEQAVQKFLDLSPNNPNAHYLLGEASLFQGEFGGAAREYAKALELDPAFGDAGLKLAHIDVLEDRAPAAIARLRGMVDSTSLPAGHRITAATDAAHLLRAEGRCPEAEKMLVDLGPQLAAEKITVAYALWIRAHCRLDAGDPAGALTLTREAITKSPGRPTRYVLMRGLVETASGDLAAAGKTISELRALQPPSADDRSEQAAAEYLAGLRALASKDAAGAVAVLNDSIAAGGTRYEVYEVALAKALAANGNVRGAIAAARAAADRGPPGDLKLEYEPGRREAARLIRGWGG